MNNQFTKQELGILKQHVKSSIVHHSLNEGPNSDAFIATGGEFVAKICMMIEAIDKELQDEAKKENPSTTEVNGETEEATAIPE